ncbi:hypothetical protein A1O1_00706 [Capronia coronata CBS 617.96]|uniref:Bacteriorhodopsin n=1 Tax=Capronia coronata CBS 617.96 TaxID=1182541 RepID=W9ZM64_9EURO|nr:uncharacterized protein A1O1_00706 [Capronia coronata CBS 617.96]EXJ95584.1 hypothetical protein A1O1_00706 [Capronia coronata CBS 617.96]
MSDLQRRNDAVDVNNFNQNNNSVVIHQTDRGSDWYFAVCAMMGATALTILVLSRRKPRTDRVFFYLSGGLCLVACIAYFAMGSNLGWTPIDVEYLRNNPKVSGRNRQIFYVRYIDWFVTTPLLLLDLLLTAGMPWPTILWVIGLDEIMIVTGLVGALVRSRYKWGFYAFGCAAMFYIFYELAFVARRHAAALGADVHRAFTLCGVLTLVVWLCYPIAWGVSEGGNVIAPDSEGIFYGILDLLAKPVFSLALIYSHWNIDPARLGLRIRDFGDSASLSSAEREKRNGHGHGPGAGAGLGTTGPLSATGTGVTTGTGSEATRDNAAGPGAPLPGTGTGTGV